MIRPLDVPVIIGNNNNKIKKATGWKPKLSYMEDTLADTLDYWKNNI